MPGPAANPLSLDYIRALDIGKRSRGAAIGLLFYDHVITLDREISLVWMRDCKKRPAFWLYFFNRFFSFAWYIFDTVPITPSGKVSENVCVIYLLCDSVVTALATLSVQIILQLRIYALYDRNKRILCVLLALCFAEVICMSTLIGVTVKHVRRVPLVSTPTGCAYQGWLQLSTLFWIPMLVFEPILFGLVAWKAWGKHDNYPSIPLVRRIARGSLIYFIAIFIELLASTIIWARAPQWINIINPWSAALPSILGSRLMLDMLEAVKNQGTGRSYIIETFSDPVITSDFDDERTSSVEHGGGEMISLSARRTQNEG